MSRRHEKRRRIFIGNLPTDVVTREVEGLFQKYGTILEVHLLMPREGRRYPPYAFVEFEEPISAEVAIRRRNRTKLGDSTIRVEYSRSGGRRNEGSFIGGGTGYNGQSQNGIGRGSKPPLRSDYSVRVTGLPPGVVWQDLKQYMKVEVGGRICFCDVFQDGSALVEFANCYDMKRAVKKLDNSTYTSEGIEPFKIRVKEDCYGSSDTGRSSSRRRSRSRNRTRSRSYSRVTRAMRSPHFNRYWDN